MAYTRKTTDQWVIEANYGFGWEVECINTSYKEGKACLKDYRENGGGQYRLEKRRVPIENIKSKAS